MSRTWSWKLGAEVSIAEVITPRPGVQRLTRVVIRSRETGQTLVTIPQLEMSRFYVSPSVQNTNSTKSTHTAESNVPDLSTYPIYRLELTEPTITLNGREEMLRILEQALITRCGEPAINIQWSSPVLTAQYVKTDGQHSTIRLRNLHGSLSGGDSLETLHSLAEAFFTLDNPVIPPADVLPVEWSEKPTLDFATPPNREHPRELEESSASNSPLSTPNRFIASTDPNSLESATNPNITTISPGREIHLWMERYYATERSLLRMGPSAITQTSPDPKEETPTNGSATSESVVRTFYGLDTGSSSIPAQYLAMIAPSVPYLGTSALFRGRIFGRLDAQLLRMEAIEVVHCDPSPMMHQMQSPHWLEADSTLRGFDAQWNHGQIEWANGTFYAENGVISGSFVREAASRLRCPTVFSNGVQPPDVAFSRLAFRFELQNDGIQISSLDNLPEMLFSDPKGNLFPVVLVDRQEKPVLGQPKQTEQPVSLSMFVQAMIPPPISQEKTVVTAYRGKYEQLLRKLPSGSHPEDTLAAPAQMADARHERP